ncbi:hypothetical protein GGI00_004392 [Coemansia sp. RSA 2681]|nr:hypothetical protein GGI00_004392 [Coemansia sp. RSA 2681]
MSKWEAPEIARRVIPCLSLLLIDGEKPVRTAAFKCLNAMASRVEAYSQTLPDTMAKKAATAAASAPAATNAGQASGNAQTEAAASMAASDTWGGWAVSSLSSTFSGALSLASSSLPIGQQQQQPLSPSVATEGAGPEKSKIQVSAIFSKPAAAAPAIGGGGWEFNDDAWGNDAAVGDGWDVDNDDDEGWDSPDPPAKPLATVSSSSGYTTLPAGSKSGGMTMSSTQPLLPSVAAPGGASLPVASKTSLKLAQPTANSQKPALDEASISAAIATTTTAPRRKGLGAMKLGGSGASKKALPPNLDEFF